MVDDTKQDTSGFWTLLVIAEVSLDPIYTGEYMLQHNSFKTMISS